MFFLNDKCPERKKGTPPKKSLLMILKTLTHGCFNISLRWLSSITQVKIDFMEICISNTTYVQFLNRILAMSVHNIYTLTLNFYCFTSKSILFSLFILKFSLHWKKGDISSSLFIYLFYTCFYK